MTLSLRPTFAPRVARAYSYFLSYGVPLEDIIDGNIKPSFGRVFHQHPDYTFLENLADALTSHCEPYFRYKDFDLHELSTHLGTLTAFTYFYLLHRSFDNIYQYMAHQFPSLRLTR